MRPQPQQIPIQTAAFPPNPREQRPPVGELAPDPQLIPATPAASPLLVAAPTSLDESPKGSVAVEAVFVDVFVAVAEDFLVVDELLLLEAAAENSMRVVS